MWAIGRNQVGLALAGVLLRVVRVPPGFVTHSFRHRISPRPLRRSVAPRPGREGGGRLPWASAPRRPMGCRFSLGCSRLSGWCGARSQNRRPRPRPRGRGGSGGAGGDGCPCADRRVDANAEVLGPGAAGALPPPARMEGSSSKPSCLLWEQGVTGVPRPADHVGD